MIEEHDIEDRILAAVGDIGSDYPELVDVLTIGSPGLRTAPKALIQAKDDDGTDQDIDLPTRVVSLSRFAVDVLKATCRMVMEERPITSAKALPRGDDVAGMCEFLERHAEWIADEWIDGDGVADDLESLAGHIATLVRPFRKEWIYLGDCPFVVTDDEGRGSVCRGRVRVRVGSDGDQAACSSHGDLAPIEWWDAVLGIGLSGRIVGTAELVKELGVRLHMTVTERTVRNWVRDGLLTPHVPFGPVENPRRPVRAWWFDLGLAVDQAAMMGRGCVSCDGPTWGRASMCLRCLEVMHQGPIFKAEKPAYPWERGRVS